MEARTAMSMPSRCRNTSCAVLLFAVLGVAGPAAAQTVIIPGQLDTAMAGRMIAAVNQARQQAGLGPVAPNVKLGQVAQALANDLAARRMLTHIDTKGRGIGDRFLQADYVYSVADELIAGGRPTPEDVVAQWLASPADRDNLLNPAVQEAGVGIAFRSEDVAVGGLGNYWVLDLGLGVERGPGP
jgi:uncharacterized protein YkwD